MKSLCYMAVLLLLIIIVTETANASCVSPNKGFWTNPQGRGWFWGQTLCKAEPEDNISLQKSTTYSEWKILPEKANIPWELLDKLDPDEIAKKIEPEARKVSIMYPSEENITAYRKLNNWMVAKSVAYVNADQRVRTENPSLMPWNDRLGTTPYKEKAITALLAAESGEQLRNYKDVAGLVVYVSKTCPFCERQIPILDTFEAEYGWNIIYRNVALYPDEVADMGVETTPDIFIALKSASDLKYQRIATGLTTLDSLEKAALRGLSYLGEKLNEKIISY